MGKVTCGATVSLDGWAAPILLDGPSLVVRGERVTHLRFTIRRL